MGCQKYKNDIQTHKIEEDKLNQLLDTLQCEYGTLKSKFENLQGYYNECSEKLELYEYQIPAPQYLEGIGYSELRSILKAEFPSIALHLSDRDYKTTSKTELERFMKHDLTDARQYIAEYYDCDDFSYTLMGAISNPEWGALPFGILWANIPGGAHAVNCFVDKKRQVWIVEPQNDSIFACPDNWAPYFIVM